MSVVALVSNKAVRCDNWICLENTESMLGFCLIQIHERWRYKERNCKSSGDEQLNIQRCVWWRSTLWHTIGIAWASWKFDESIDVCIPMKETETMAMHERSASCCKTKAFHCHIYAGKVKNIIVRFCQIHTKIKYPQLLVSPRFETKPMTIDPIWYNDNLWKALQPDVTI